MTFCEIILTIAISLVSSIIGGYIVIIYMNFKENRRWHKTKEFVERDWLSLLRATFDRLQMFVRWPTLFGYYGLNWDSYHNTYMFKQEMWLLTYIEDFRNDVLQNFDNKYYPNILKYEKNVWISFQQEIRDVISYGEIVISRILSFSRAEPKVIKRVYDWKERIASLEYYCETVISDMDIEGNDKRVIVSSSIIKSYINDFMRIADDEIKSRQETINSLKKEESNKST